MRFECRHTQRPLWRLNVRLLTIEDFVLLTISFQIDSFISVNATPDITHGTILETFKAYIRG